MAAELRALLAMTDLPAGNRLIAQAIAQPHSVNARGLNFTLLCPAKATRLLLQVPDTEPAG